jgi:excisionase family DNA binding protein
MTVAGLATRSERPRRRLGTVDDVLAVLPLPKSSLYDLARYGRMPGVVRVGRRLLFDLDTLDEWIAAGGGRPE